MPTTTTPKIPKRALLSGAALSFSKTGGRPSLLTVPHGRYVTSGRVAIAIALQRIGIGADDEILVPAYHCPAMVGPIRHYAARPVFYDIEADTAVDAGDIESKITPSTRAIIIVHYFGFPQDMDRILELCRSRGLILIEDCAHACYGEYNGRPLGSFGDYAIGSMMKFFPVFDGGLIASSDDDLAGVELASAGAVFETQAATSMLEAAFQFGRMRVLRLPVGLALKAKDLLWRMMKKGKKNKAPVRPAASDGGQTLESRWIDKRISAPSRFVVEHTDQERLIRRRRQHYQTLSRGLAALPGATLLHPLLPDNVVPYVLPILVDEPDKVYQPLRASGLPVVRFAEDSIREPGVRTCPVSARFAEQCLQLPCHQDLEEDELQWMIETTRAVFRRHQRQAPTALDGQATELSPQHAPAQPA